MRFDVSHWMLNDMLKVNFNMVKTFHKNSAIIERPPIVKYLPTGYYA